MIQKIFICFSALLLTQTLWAQSTARLTVTGKSLNKNGVATKIENASENEKNCLEAQVSEIEMVGIVPTIHFSPNIRVYLFSNMSDDNAIIVQEALDNEVELVDDFSDLNKGGSSVTVTLSSDGICKVTSAETISEIFKNYLY